MSKEDLSKVIAGALVDHQFLSAVHQDPAKAATTIAAPLNADEVTSVQDLL